VCASPTTLDTCGNLWPRTGLPAIQPPRSQAGIQLDDRSAASVAPTGERELATTIRGFVGWARLDLLGQQGGEPERRAVGQILEWATAAVEFDLI
jgi:hypothetical protein